MTLPRKSISPPLGRRPACGVRHLLLMALLLLVTGCSPDAAPQPSMGSAVSPGAASTAATRSPAVSPPVAEGSSARSLTVAGVAREYRVYRPSGLATKAPLVLVFHGYTWSATRTEQQFGWNMLADAEGFVVVYPQGLDAGFNAGTCCGPSSDNRVDDVAAALAMVDDVAAHVPVDPDRLYVTGFSNGGAMAYRLACETDRFAAFGPVAGGLVVDCGNAKPTSILHVHGLADRIVPPGGDGGIWRIPVAKVLADWRQTDGCTDPVVSDSGRTHLATAACAAGREVGLITIDHLDHAWPTTADGLDTTPTLWAFFQRHVRGG